MLLQMYMIRSWRFDSIGNNKDNLPLPNSNAILVDFKMSIIIMTMSVIILLTDIGIKAQCLAGSTEARIR